MKTIQFLAIMILMLVSQVVTATTTVTPPYQEGTIMNVWAVNGLNMRDGPGKDHEVLRKLHYGDEIKIVDPFIGDFPMSIKVVDKKGNDQDIELKGHWVRVRLDNVEGYVFDGYLSRLPVIRLNSVSKNEEGITFYHSETLGEYLNRKLEVEKESEEDTSVAGYSRKFYFENDIVLTDGASEGCAWTGLDMKNVSLNEGYLIFNLIYQFESNTQTEEFDYSIQKNEDGSFRIIFGDDMYTLVFQSTEKGIHISSEGCC